jgi:hypothetical protein
MVQRDKLSGTVVVEVCALTQDFGRRRLWARGYRAVSSVNLIDAMIKQYIDGQDGNQWW